MIVVMVPQCPWFSGTANRYQIHGMYFQSPPPKNTLVAYYIQPHHCYQCSLDSHHMHAGIRGADTLTIAASESSNLEILYKL